MSVSIFGEGKITGLPGFRFVGTRYFTSSGTFAKADPLATGDIGLRAIRVRMVGGGGGSGGAPATGAGEVSVGGPGGGAAYAETFITNIAGLSSSETVTVGAGGAAGAAGGAGGGGGQSSAFGVSANGGGGGGVGTAGAPLSGLVGGEVGVGATAPSGHDLRILGGQGFAGFATDTFRIFRGTNGASFLGAIRSFAVTGSSGPGFGPGEGNYGTGAIPGVCSVSSAAQVGAAGTEGIIIVDCFV